jgi:signal transduction histidine kinase
LADLQAMLTRTLAVARSINDSILHVMHNLEDSTLAEEGLRAAIENYIQRYWSAYSVQFNSNLGQRLPPEMEGQLFRIAQEAITNACKHGVDRMPDGCVRVDLAYDGDRHCVRLSVADNGIGFDLEAERPQSLGLHMMKQRAKRLKTVLDIQSIAEHGTTVQVTASTTLDLQDEDI